MARNESRPFMIYILIFLILFQGLSGILGGIGLISDPTGELLQIPLSWLDGSPFSDYLIPGLFLLIVLGFLPLVISYGLWKQLRWSWFGSLLLGIVLIIWVVVEILIIGYHSQPPLQLIYGSIGSLILVLVLLPSVQRSYKDSQS